MMQHASLGFTLFGLHVIQGPRFLGIHRLSHVLECQIALASACQVVKKGSECQMTNSKHPNSVEGANLEAAALVSLGQSVNAKAKLTKFKGDSIVDENLARLL